MAVRVTTTKESPDQIRKKTEIAEFSIVTPEQYKYIKPVDTANLIMIPQGDFDRTNYLHELLRRNIPEQRSNTF